MSGADIEPVLARSPVIPVVTIDPGVDAVALARALLEGGIPIIELTLRTDSALRAIGSVAAELPEMLIGAGTVWTGEQARAAAAAGARFLVSPGISDEVHEAAVELDIPLLPGAQTASEVAHWVRRGLTAVKFFPAAVAGGIPALKALSAVFPGLKFCPTGGIGAETAADYLALASVPCVGGSWLTPSRMVAAADWTGLTELARRARDLAAG